MSLQAHEQVVSQAVASRYQNSDKTKLDVMTALHNYRGLVPKLEKFVFNDGIERELLNLAGTIPVRFKGSVYNIPVCIWILDNHPFSPPMVYVKPTPDMLIKASRHVDQNGKVFLPYLHEWNLNSSDLVGLIQIMIMVFNEMPPVYSKPKTHTTSATPYPSAFPGNMPDMDDRNPNTAEPSIHPVELKLSPFCSKEPTVWFQQAELQFQQSGVTDSLTKLDCVLEAIPEELLPCIATFFEHLDDEDVKYEDLKSYLLQEFTLSASTRAQRLLNLPQVPLGDTTAQAAWNEIQTLATLPHLDPNTSKPQRVDLLRELWLQRLPPSVRDALHDADDSPMEDLVEKADSLINEARASGTDDATSSVITEDHPNTNATKMINEARASSTYDANSCAITEDHPNTNATKMINEARASGTNDAISSVITEDHPNTNAAKNTTRRRRPNNRTRGRKQVSGQNPPDGLCYYHYNFGDEARKCVSGCQWYNNL